MMAKPLLNIHSENEPYCDYPTTLKVPMDDGTIQTYLLHETKKAVSTKGNCEHHHQEMCAYDSSAL